MTHLLLNLLVSFFAGVGAAACSIALAYALANLTNIIAKRFKKTTKPDEKKGGQ